MEDEYLMPITDMLINVSLAHRIISFLDGTVSYNQIFLAEGDMSKMAFNCSWEMITLQRLFIYELPIITMITFNGPSSLNIL